MVKMKHHKGQTSEDRGTAQKAPVQL